MIRTCPIRPPILCLLLATALSPGFVAAAPGDIVSAETRAYAAQRLDEAEAALAGGDIETAWKAVEAAARAPTEFHGRGLAVVSSRELGDDLYGRIFDLRRQIRLTQGRKAEAEGLVFDRPGQREAAEPWRWDSRDALTWYMGAPDPDAVVRLARTAPADHRILTRMLGSFSVSEDGEAVYGVGRAGSGVAMAHEPLWDRYEPLPREVELQRRFEEEVVPVVLGRIRGEADELLAEEQTLYSRPPTEREQQVLTAGTQLAGVSQALTGLAEQPASPEIQLKLFRADDSQSLLRQARDWLESVNEVVEVDGEFRSRRARPDAVIERAVARGDEMLAIGDDSTVPLPEREDAYDEAEDYYDVARDRERRQTAAARLEQLQPALDEYRARREAAKDAMQEKLSRQAAEMEQAVKDMEKTEEEKKAFKEEADALEDELGF